MSTASALTQKSAAAAKPSARDRLTFSMSLKPLKVKVGNTTSGQKICAQHCRFMTSACLDAAGTAIASSTHDSPAYALPGKDCSRQLERLGEQLLNVCSENTPSPPRWNRRVLARHRAANRRHRPQRR